MHNLLCIACIAGVSFSSHSSVDLWSGPYAAWYRQAPWNAARILEPEDRHLSRAASARGEVRHRASPATRVPEREQKTAAPTMTREQRLERCRYLKRRVDHFTRLRRAGGNAMRMERWRKSRERYASEFRQLRCQRLGRQLRR